MSDRLTSRRHTIGPVACGCIAGVCVRVFVRACARVYLCACACGWARVWARFLLVNLRHTLPFLFCFCFLVPNVLCRGGRGGPWSTPHPARLITNMVHKALSCRHVLPRFPPSLIYIYAFRFNSFSAVRLFCVAGCAATAATQAGRAPREAGNG